MKLSAHMLTSDCCQGNSTRPQTQSVPWLTTMYLQMGLVIVGRKECTHVLPAGLEGRIYVEVLSHVFTSTAKLYSIY